MNKVLALPALLTTTPARGHDPQDQVLQQVAPCPTGVI